MIVPVVVDCMHMLNWVINISGYSDIKKTNFIFCFCSRGNNNFWLTLLYNFPGSYIHLRHFVVHNKNIIYVSRTAHNLVFITWHCSYTYLKRILKTRNPLFSNHVVDIIYHKIICGLLVFYIRLLILSFLLHHISLWVVSIMWINTVVGMFASIFCLFQTKLLSFLFNWNGFYIFDKFYCIFSTDGVTFRWDIPVVLIGSQVG